MCKRSNEGSNRKESILLLCGLDFGNQGKWARATAFFFDPAPSQGIQLMRIQPARTENAPIGLKAALIASRSQSAYLHRHVKDSPLPRQRPIRERAQ